MARDWSPNAIRLSNLYRADSIATSVGASAFVSLLSRVIGLGRSVALAWLIPQAQFGLFGVALLVVNILLPVCSAGLYDGVTRYTPFHESAGTLRRFAIRSSLLAVGMALASTAVLAVFAGPVGTVLFSQARLASGAVEPGPDAGMSTDLARGSLVCVLALTAYHTFLGLLKGLRMFRVVAAVELFTACLFTLLAVVGATRGFTTAQALIIMYALSCVLGVLAFVPGLVRQLSLPENPAADGDCKVRPCSLPRPGSNLVHYSVWAAGIAVLWHALSYYPMWYLLKVSDGATVGTFHAVRTITQFVQVGAVMLTAVVAANVTRTWEHEGRGAALPRLALLTKACLSALTLGALVLSLARPVVVRMFPAAFAAGVAAYDPLLLFFLLVGVVGLFAVRLNLVEKPRTVCLAWIVGGIVNVLASYALLAPGDIGTSGDQAGVLRAAAWAGVAGVTSALIVCVLLIRREKLAVDSPTLLLGAAGFSVGLGWPVALTVALLLTAAVLVSGAIFPAHERAQLRLILIGPRGRPRT